MNVLPLNYEYICKKVNFLVRLRTAKNSLLITLFSKFGSNDMRKLCSDLNVSNGAVRSVIKRKLWELKSYSPKNFGSGEAWKRRIIRHRRDMI